MPALEPTAAAAEDKKFVRGLGLLDSTMLGARSMIGSGLFMVFRIELFNRADSIWRLRVLSFHRPIPRLGHDRAAHVHEHAWAEAGQARAKCFHDGEDGCADRADSARHYRRCEIRRRRGKL